MDWSNPIVYELGLTVIAAVGFWVWQMWDLKRAGRELKEEKHPEVPSQPTTDEGDGDR